MSVRILKESEQHIEIKKDAVFDNAQMTFRILDLKDDYALLVALNDDGTSKPYYVVAFLLADDGTWAQGHYFTSLAAATKYFTEVTSA